MINIKYKKFILIIFSLIVGYFLGKVKVCGLWDGITDTGLPTGGQIYCFGLYSFLPNEIESQGLFRLIETVSILLHSALFYLLIMLIKKIYMFFRKKK